MSSLNLRNVRGKPTVFKGLKIYPIKMKHVEEFYDYVQCLLIPKNTHKDIAIIKMSYLKFLIHVSITENYGYLLYFLNKLLELTFKTNDVKFDENNKGKLFIYINNVEITESDFDKIRSIICDQNLIILDEEITDPELEKKINEAREFLEKRNGKIADLEQQIIAYHCVSGITYGQIDNLTIYQFRKGLSRMDLIKQADILQSARYSGFVSFKDDTVLPTWLSFIEERDPNEDIIMSKGDFDKFAIDNGLTSK